MQTVSPTVEKMVDGYKGFLFMDKDGMRDAEFIQSEKAWALDGAPEPFGGEGHKGRVQEGEIDVIISLQRGVRYAIIRT